jgi:hypothetical protein
MSTISASTTTTTAYKVTADTTGTLVLQTGATPTTAVTIDGSQNVGVGVTPAGWSGGYKSVDVTSGASFFGYPTSYAGVSTNAVNNGGWKYRNTAAAALYQQEINSHVWYNAPSGTAGNAITFTQAMTLDASGNLLVGTTTSNGYKLVVASANGVSVSGWGSGIGVGMVLSTTVTASNSDAISFNQNATQVGRIQTSSVGTTLYLGTSDSRLKVDNGVCTDTSVIDQTVIHEFTWKQNNVADRGVFAQEAYLVKPHAIYKGEDTLNEDGSLKSPWGVDYSKYVPDLIVYAQQLKKTAQEQQALITQLQADVAALKG